MKRKKKEVTTSFIEQLALEGALIKGAEQLRETAGDDAFEAMVVELILPFEKELRKKEAPDHPALLLLDEWRADQQWRAK